MRGMGVALMTSKMRTQPLLVAQRAKLLHAKTVLLIHHHQPQILKQNALLNQRRGAPPPPSMVPSQPGQYIGAPAASYASGEESDLSGVLFGRADWPSRLLMPGAVVLFGQNLGRRQRTDCAPF
ncbi:MAG: hypothetical protein R2911_00275 [Caldilineaceae bacterium]